MEGFPLPGKATIIAALILLAWFELVLPNLIPLKTFAGTLSKVKILMLLKLSSNNLRNDV